MNPTYSSPRNTTSPYLNIQHPPFYHPLQKETSTGQFTSPLSKHASHFPQPTNTQPSSKSYFVKNNYEHPKPTNNNSAYLKTSIQTANSSTGFQTFPSNYPKNSGEMAKSNFHDHSKGLQAPTSFPRPADKVPIGTPTRRQPRFSEPGNMEHPFDGLQDTKGSFVPFKPKELDRQKEQSHMQHFYKKHSTTVGDPTRQEQKREWLKKSPSMNHNLGTPLFPKGKNQGLSLESFELGRNIGSGKYGKVFLARDKLSGFMCALKIIEKAVLREQEIVDQFIREVKIQMYLNHPNIIKMYGCFDDKQHIYIVLEVGIGGQLYQQLKRSEPMPEVKVASFMKQICSAVQELHASRIIHRDIKPQNIVLHENIVKLCDFGWSVHLGNKMRTTFCGTPLYVCPQILKGNEYDEKIDIWSIGIMMYQMLIGENPFKINTQEQLIKIVRDQICIPSYVFVSRQARDFLDKCLQKNPTDRVTIKELVNHPFFTKNAQKEKAQKKMVF